MKIYIMNCNIINILSIWLIYLVSQSKGFIIHQLKTRFHYIPFGSTRVNVNPWIGIADIDTSSLDDDGVIIETFKNHFELSSPRAWLEFNEVTNKNYGAYTVLRCDLSQQKHDLGRGVAKVWGQEFHFNRLRHSYNMIQASSESYCKDVIKFDQNEIQDAINLAFDHSEKILKNIIQRAIISCLDSEGSEKDIIKTFIVTLLWTPLPRSNNDEDLKIRVQGHLFCSNEFTNSMLSCKNSHISIASIALPITNTTLPSRYDNIPEAKISSWCRSRKPIEAMYKDKQIAEVLLVREKVIRGNDNDPEFFLLEGLTSNLFIVYKDGSIHTNCVENNECGGVLDGYARSLVINAAEKLDIPLALGPISLEDAKTGLWAEVFTTSSVKLISPISKIVLPTINNVKSDDHHKVFDFEEFWTETSLEELTWTKRKWQLLYEILPTISIMTTYTS